MSDRFKTLLLKSVDVPVPAEACVDGTVYDGVGMTWHDRLKYRCKYDANSIIWCEANVNDALVATSSTTFPVPIEWILPYEFQHGTHPARCAFHIISQLPRRPRTSMKLPFFDRNFGRRCGSTKVAAKCGKNSGLYWLKHFPNGRVLHLWKYDTRRCIRSRSWRNMERSQSGFDVDDVTVDGKHTLCAFCQGALVRHHLKRKLIQRLVSWLLPWSTM